jgi:DNA-binding transcriptional ArsR family regulator
MSLEKAQSRQQLRALSHPVRLRILSLASGAAMSSAELARELGMNHAAVSFHVRQLVSAGFLTLAETRSVRGGQERRYRHDPAGRGHWTDEDARLTVQAVSTEVLRRLADVPSVRWRLFADAELWVDPAVWADAASRIAAAVGDLHAAALTPHAPGALHVSTTALLFSADDDTAADDTAAADTADDDTGGTTAGTRDGPHGSDLPGHGQPRHDLPSEKSGDQDEQLAGRPRGATCRESER